MMLILAFLDVICSELGKRLIDKLLLLLASIHHFSCCEDYKGFGPQLNVVICDQTEAFSFPTVLLWLNKY